MSTGPAPPRNAAALWARFGVRWDDLSTQVLVLNLPGRGIDQIAAWLGEAARFGEPFRLTLRQLMGADLEVAPGRVRICENPAVVTTAADELAEDAAPLVCTEGQPSSACHLLLEVLTAQGCRLAHRGDFDWAGLRIAGALAERHRVAPWRFGAGDYARAADAVGERAAPLSGSPVESPWDPDLAETMTRRGRAIYEEQVIDDLLADLDTRRR
ncbi:MAG: TIGR02679 family protein [Acidimicrobiia bacterium]|nr:TIGR02679 family protein [Acidimicrobiia bacterium]